MEAASTGHGIALARTSFVAGSDIAVEAALRTVGVLLKRLMLSGPLQENVQARKQESAATSCRHMAFMLINDFFVDYTQVSQ